MPSIIVATGPLNLIDRIVKRLFDMAVTSVALLCLLFTAALAAKFTSPGRILFKQVRIGRGNQMFRMYNFVRCTSSSSIVLAIVRRRAMTIGSPASGG